MDEFKKCAVQKLKEHARGFYDPETTCSSWLSHVPQSACRVFVYWLAAIHAWSLIHGAHLAYQETFFADLRRLNLQQLSLEVREIWPQHHAVKCLWIWKTCRAGKWIGASEFCNSNSKICKEVVNWESSLSCRRSLSAKSHGWKADSRILIRSSVGKRASVPRYVLVQAFLRTLCCGTKK